MTCWRSLGRPTRTRSSRRLPARSRIKRMSIWPGEQRVDDRTRWAKIVRGEGAVIVYGHHEIEVPPEGGLAVGERGREGLRVLCQPVGATPPIFAIDVTSTAARAMLEGFLGSGVLVGRRLSWSSKGYGHRRRDTVKINWE